MSLSKLSDSFAVIATVLWVGGMWAVGYLAVPLLFRSLADRQLAGMLAGKMFSLMAFVGLVCALYLLFYHLQQHGKVAWQKTAVRLVLIMLALLVIGEFVLQPMMSYLKMRALPLAVMQSAFATEFKALHGVASILYLVQSLLGATLVLGLKRGKYYAE